MIIKYAFIWTEKCLKRLKTILSQLTYSRPHVNISFWPSGSKAASFSLFFISFGTFSSYIFYGFLNFSFFFSVLWSKCMWLACFNEWATLREAVMIGSLEFHGWNPPVQTIFNLHNEVHAPWPMNHMHSDRFVKKNNKKYQNHQR